MKTTNNNNVNNNNVNNNNNNSLDFRAALAELGEMPLQVAFKEITRRAAAADTAALGARLDIIGTRNVSLKHVTVCREKKALLVKRSGDADKRPERPEISGLGADVVNIHNGITSADTDNTAAAVAAAAAHVEACYEKELEKYAAAVAAYDKRHAEIVEILKERGVDAETAENTADNYRIVNGKKRKNAAGKDFICFNVATVWASIEFTFEAVLSQFDAAETAKTETAKTETAKTETAKTETAKTETAKTETAKTETAKTETAKTETAPTLNAGRRSLFARFNKKATGTK